MEVSLTAAGQRVFDTVYPIAVEHQTNALRGFSKSELTTLQAYLQRIQQNIALDSEIQASGN